MHPLPLSHAAIWQLLASGPGQMVGVSEVQTPRTHVSPVVHKLPSSHLFPLIPLCTQPSVGLHASLVQALPSSQVAMPLPLQLPVVQLSTRVQGLPSSQVLPLVGDHALVLLAGLQLLHASPGLPWPLTRQMPLMRHMSLLVGCLQ